PRTTTLLMKLLTLTGDGYSSLRAWFPSAAPLRVGVRPSVAGRVRVQAWDPGPSGLGGERVQRIQCITLAKIRRRGIRKPWRGGGFPPAAPGRAGWADPPVRAEVAARRGSQTIARSVGLPQGPAAKGRYSARRTRRGPARVYSTPRQRMRRAITAEARQP